MDLSGHVAKYNSKKDKLKLQEQEGDEFLAEAERPAH
jgi:hypothetical protein